MRAWIKREQSIEEYLSDKSSGVNFPGQGPFSPTEENLKTLLRGIGGPSVETNTSPVAKGICLKQTRPQSLRSTPHSRLDLRERGGGCGWCHIGGRVSWGGVWLRV